MKMEHLQKAQRILVINWIIAPLLGFFVFMQKGLTATIAFIIIWLIADKVWDWLTGIMISMIGQIGASEDEALKIRISGDVPSRIAVMMIIDLVGTLALPWIIACLFLIIK